MKTSLHIAGLCAWLSIFIAMSASASVYTVTGSATMYDPTGSITGVVDNGVTGTYNDTDPALFSIAAGQPFFGLLWQGDGSIFGQGIWSFETCPFPRSPDGGGDWIASDGSTKCGSELAPNPISMDVNGNQWGGHFLVAWGTNQNIDVVNVWDVAISPSGTIHLSSTDPDGDGVLGTSMKDGPFKGFSWSYNLTLTTVPIPPAAWLFTSGLLGLFEIARSKKA